MSNDLISRKALSENICNAECKIPKFKSKKELNAFLLGLNAKQIVVMECLSGQPTAYDPDKVVEQLESEAERWHESGKEYDDKNELGVAAGYRYAIKIVKGSGLE